MANNPPQGSPKYGKCLTKESVENINTLPEFGGDTLIRSESITVINTP